MAKWRNVPVGTKVKVKNGNLIAAERSSAGRKGEVVYCEHEEYGGICFIKVVFSDDTTDWMHHKDVKLVKELV